MTQSRIPILDSSPRTGAFHQMPITACSVNNSEEMGQHGRQVRCRVKLLTAGHTTCSVKRALVGYICKQKLSLRLD